MKKTVLIFGDSNSWGWKPENDIVNTLERWDDDVRWGGVMQAELGDGYKVIVDGLNARTTVWDDPIEEYRCGKNQIVPSMDAHAPFDMMVIFLGSNDLKVRYSVCAEDIANSAALLIQKAKNMAGDFTGDPKILLICPPPLGDDVSKGIFANTFAPSLAKSKEMGKYYAKVAQLNGVEFLDAGTVVESSKIDGLHLDADAHQKLGKAVAPIVKKMIG